jgi:hypothetical protein
VDHGLDLHLRWLRETTGTRTGTWATISCISHSDGAIQVSNVPVCESPATNCIVGQALAFAGVGSPEIEAMPDDERDLYLPGELPVTVTLGAQAVFHEPPQIQDRDCRKGDVPAYATAAAVRFIDPVPDAAFAVGVIRPSPPPSWCRGDPGAGWPLIFGIRGRCQLAVIGFHSFSLTDIPC